jgi:hypothetical protein
MKTRNHAIFAATAVLVLSILACNLPNAAAPTPFVFPTPDRTQTAASAEQVTPTPPVVITATPVLLPGTPTAPPVLGTFIPGTLEPGSTVAPTSLPTTGAPVATNLPQPTAAQASATPNNLRRGPLVEAPYLRTAPNIDGDLSDWAQPLYPIGHIVYGANRWDNAADLSANFMIGWDVSYLYIAVRVVDEDYVQNARGSEMYMGDSIEIMLDTDLEGDFTVTVMNADDHQLGISPGSPEVGNDMEAYLWQPVSRAGSRSDVRIGARRTANGYDIEVAVPWSLYGITAQEERTYGFALSVSDNDRTGFVEQQTMISNVSTRRYNDPTTWGNLRLLKP